MTQIDLDLGQKKITDVLGRVRPVDKVFPAGEWNCPFCWAAVSPERDVCRGRAGGYADPCPMSPGSVHCPNPACLANPHYPPDRARADVAAAEAKAEEERQRKANHEWAMARAEEARHAVAARQAEVRAQAEARGACVSCALYSIHFGAAATKFIKHRGACPRV